MSSPTPDIPPMKEYKSAQYEFNDEQNRQFSGLADAMQVVGGLMQLLGLAFVVLTALAVTSAVQSSSSGSAQLGHYGPAIALGSAALLTLCIGFWTGGAATSFRKIAETKNEDVWHLMNAVGSLHNMYGLLRTIILGSLVLSVVAGVLAALTLAGK